MTIYNENIMASVGLAILKHEKSVSDAAILAAIRAVFEHLRDNALPYKASSAMQEILWAIVVKDETVTTGDGERIFLAGIEKLLETLGK